jgi:hypothetical protein
VNGLTDALASLNVTAVSPDGEIRAWARSPAEIGIEVAGNSFRSYTERSLEHQLDQLATVLFARYHRAYGDTVTDYLRPPDGRPEPARNDDATVATMAALVVHGWSEQRTVGVVTRGLKDWTFSIEDGAIARLRSFALGAEIVAAARSTIGTFDAYSVRLRRRAARAQAVPLDLDAWQLGRLW